MEDKDRIAWFKYVPYYAIEEYETLGWAVVSYGGPYAALMKWLKDGDPVVPPKE